MKKLIVWMLCLVGISSAFGAEPPKPVNDRNTLCSLEFGRFANGVYVGSTPMEDACRTDHYESRKEVCNHNYDRAEVSNACVLTYDAITERIRKSKNK